MIKKILKKVFGVFGYSIHKKKQVLKKEQGNNFFKMQKALERCVERGMRINTVIDVGASDGVWSKACMKTIPQAQYLLVEAQSVHKSGLDKLKHEHGNVNYVLAAAGKQNGTIYFDNSEPFGGLASENKIEGSCIEVPMICLDDEIIKKQLKPPYLLKLDTHGFEIPILEGANALLRNAELVIIETYNYKLTQDSLRYWEMCSYMEGLGFSPIEMVDFMQRKYDNSFWQMDTFFIPSNSKEFLYNSYI